VLPSNRRHQGWVTRKLTRRFADLSRTAVAVWGLAYKPDTSTLRRSSAVELCDWLLDQGAAVRVHDPAVEELPSRWSGRITRFSEPLEAAAGANALVIATGWPMYQRASADQLAQGSDELLVLDANRCAPQLATPHAQLTYTAVGMPDPDA
jgi:UDPglucose 6-dehydrogenase